MQTAEAAMCEKSVSLSSAADVRVRRALSVLRFVVWKISNPCSTDAIRRQRFRLAFQSPYTTSATASSSPFVSFPSCPALNRFYLQLVHRGLVARGKIVGQTFPPSYRTEIHFANTFAGAVHRAGHIPISARFLFQVWRARQEHGDFR